MPWERDPSGSLFEKKDEQSSSKRRCFGQIHFSPLMCDIFLITPLIGFKLLILFNFTPNEL